MSRFHCCFVADDNRVADVELLEAENEIHAARRAGEMLHARPEMMAAEVWRAGKFVIRVQSSTEPEEALPSLH
jgi:hypothetical protein